MGTVCRSKRSWQVRVTAAARWNRCGPERRRSHDRRCVAHAHAVYIRQVALTARIDGDSRWRALQQLTTGGRGMPGPGGEATPCRPRVLRLGAECGPTTGDALRRAVERAAGPARAGTCVAAVTDNENITAQRRHRPRRRLMSCRVSTGRGREPGSHTHAEFWLAPRLASMSDLEMWGSRYKCGGHR